MSTTPNPPNSTEQPTLDFVAHPSTAGLAARYDILGELGRGGMGIVYKARDRETSETVALKILKPEIAADERAMQRFKNELRLARKITHKNVCRIHDLHRVQDAACISMELVEGDSLRQILARAEALSVRTAIRITLQICGGLKEAHQQGVVHRDLKPENLMLDQARNVKIMDFGLAHSTEGPKSQEGALVGTPAYMSPEQAEGKAADVRSDIYALGLIVYEMLTGAAAFRGDSAFAVALKQIHNAAVPARELEPSLPVYLERIIDKCLAKDPDKRFQSVEELEEALTKQREAAPVEQGAEVTLPVHLTQWQRSDWSLLALAIAGLLVFVPAFNHTSLAPRSKVTFDRSVLRRIAKDYAQHLGAPVEGEGDIGTNSFASLYDYVAQHSGAQEALELCNNPLPYWLWSVTWENGLAIQVDNRGSLFGFSRSFSGAVSTDRLPVDEARTLAEKAIREHFGLNPAQLLFIEAAGDDTWRGRPAVSLTWTGKQDYDGIKLRYAVRFVGREIANLERVYSSPSGYRSQRVEVWQILPTVVLMLVLPALGLTQRLLVDLGARWRLAVIGLISTALVLYYWQFNSGADIALSLFLSPFVFAGAALILFFGLIPVERAVHRVAPARLASLSRLLTPLALTPPCGLAIFRGSCIGLALLGADTAAVWLGTSHSQFWLSSFGHIASTRLYLGNGWPGAHLLFAIIQASWTTSLLALFASLVARVVRRPWLIVTLAAALSVLALTTPSLAMAAIAPFPWKGPLLLLELLVLVWTFTLFDVLTLACAALTFSFCFLNCQLLVMLAPAGVLEPWIDFAIFGMIVLAAAIVACRSPSNLPTSARRRRSIKGPSVFASVA